MILTTLRRSLGQSQGYCEVYRLLNQWKDLKKKTYTDISYSRTTSWLDFQSHGFKGQGYRRRFPKVSGQSGGGIQFAVDFCLVLLITLGVHDSVRRDVIVTSVGDHNAHLSDTCPTSTRQAWSQRHFVMVAATGNDVTASLLRRAEWQPIPITSIRPSWISISALRSGLNIPVSK